MSYRTENPLIYKNCDNARVSVTHCSLKLACVFAVCSQTESSMGDEPDPCAHSWLSGPGAETEEEDFRGDHQPVIGHLADGELDR